ncbi:MAG TPA: SRPBCC family protein [Acidimicrobiales bacterium]|nr:SRPBCC family protein [Acidimicrobiales bacterium]
MALQVIEETATTQARPGAVFALLRDGSTWPDWSPLGSFELVEPGDGVPEGLGAIRIFRTKRVASREQVNVVEPDERFGYVLLSGMPLKDYEALVTLRAENGGTTIHWRSTFRAKVPGTGWLYRWQLGRFIAQVVRGLAARAEVSAVG